MADTNSKPKALIITLPNVRISYPHLFKATDYQNNKDFKYQATAIFGPEHEKLKEKILVYIKKLIRKEKASNPDWADVDELSSEYLFLRQGNDESTVRERYKDKWIVVASNKYKPVVVDRKKNHIKENEGCPISGDYVNMNITLWLQSNEHGKRVNANVVGVQFVKSG